MQILQLLVLIGLQGYPQCPCIKTAVIGLGDKSSISFSNKVIAMGDVEIPRGVGVNLFTHEHSGTLSWYSQGRRLVNLFVTPTETTSYTVKSSLEGCPDVFDRVTITVYEQSLDQQIVIFPNPIEHYATVLSEHKFIKNISIYNLSGMKVLEFSYSDNYKERLIDLIDMATGVYLVHCRLIDGTTVVEKIIKK